jgi:hypothetical protein
VIQRYDLALPDVPHGASIEIWQNDDLYVGKLEQERPSRTDIEGVEAISSNSFSRVRALEVRFEDE